MSEKKSAVRTEGLFYALVAFVWWGVVPPLYFNSLKEVPVWEVLAHRIVWSVLFLALVLAVIGKIHEIADCFKNWSLMRRLLLSTGLIAINWFVYVYGVSHEQVVQTSLGYFVNPLVNVVLGLLIFGERLRGLQWFAVALAALGVICLTVVTGELQWIALSLAITFPFYGMIRKTIPINGLVSFSVEILLLTPLSLGYLLWLMSQGQAHFGSAHAMTDFLLVLSAVVTAIPLLCFGQAARKLPLTTLGFVQYLAPTLQFLTAVFLLHEPMDWPKFSCFCFIWVGLAFYSLDSVLQYRLRKTQEKETEHVVPVESRS